MLIYYKGNNRKEKLQNLLKKKQGIIRSSYSITFLSVEEVGLITEYYQRYGKDKLEDMYRRIGTEFDSIVDDMGRYSVDDGILDPSALSTGERSMLYIYLCKYLDKAVFMIGLFEGLDKYHRRRVIDEFKGSNDKVEIMLLNNLETQGLEDFERGEM